MYMTYFLRLTVFPRPVFSVITMQKFYLKNSIVTINNAIFWAVQLVWFNLVYLNSSDEGF